MSTSYLFMFLGASIAFIASAVASVKKHQTKCRDWGEPVVTICETIGAILLVIGLFI